MTVWPNCTRSPLFSFVAVLIWLPFTNVPFRGAEVLDVGIAALLEEPGVHLRHVAVLGEHDRCSPPPWPTVSSWSSVWVSPWRSAGSSSPELHPGRPVRVPAGALPAVVAPAAGVAGARHLGCRLRLPHLPHRQRTTREEEEVEQGEKENSRTVRMPSDIDPLRRLEPQGGGPDADHVAIIEQVLADRAAR